MAGYFYKSGCHYLTTPRCTQYSQLKSFRMPSHSQSLHRISGSDPSPFMQHPPTAYFSKSKKSGSGIPYRIWRIAPMAAQLGQIKDLIRLRRLVVIMESYSPAMTLTPVIKSVLGISRSHSDLLNSPS